MSAEAQQRRQLESLGRAALEARQLARLNELLAAVLPHNPFYAAKFQNSPKRLESLSQLVQLPLTTKEELVEAGLQAICTFGVDQYVRYHQTSGTHGRPMPVLDTASDWQWWINCWQYVLDAAEVTGADRAMLAFSFGPFVGFWSAHDALAARGALVIPGGGMTSLARLELIERVGATVLCCTPSYAIHLAETAAEHKIGLSSFAVNRIIVAGEPGGSQPEIRQRIEAAWSARVIDHAGATEVGPWGYPDASRQGLHVLEAEFIAEFESTDTGAPAADGELAHMVLTSLGRRGMPCIRYRTGDLVRPSWRHDGANRFVVLEGGVLGRVDDMLIIRGVNVFPSSVESVLRSFPEVVEFRITARKRGAMDELAIEVEDHLNDPRRIAEELQIRLGLNIAVTVVPPLSLPRYEGKGRRFVDERNGKAD